MTKLDANGSANSAPAPSCNDKAVAALLRFALDISGCMMRAIPLFRTSAQHARAGLKGTIGYDGARRVDKALLLCSLASDGTLGRVV